MKKQRIKPIELYITGNTPGSLSRGEMFVDVEFLQKYRDSSPIHEYYYQGLKLTFVIDIFVFDVKSCEFFTKGDE